MEGVMNATNLPESAAGAGMNKLITSLARTLSGHLISERLAEGWYPSRITDHTHQHDRHTLIHVRNYEHKMRECLALLQQITAALPVCPTCEGKKVIEYTPGEMPDMECNHCMDGKLDVFSALALVGTQAARITELESMMEMVGALLWAGGQTKFTVSHQIMESYRAAMKAAT